MPADPSIAVLIPCYNEAAAIGNVVGGFRSALPGAASHVCDNNPSAGPAEAARAAGAAVTVVELQGKGHVVRRMFADVDADIYLLVDGDGTYDAAAAPLLVDALAGGGLDMVNAARDAVGSEAYRPGHLTGNRVLTGLVAAVFGRRLTDMLSGYRAFSRRFAKSFPALSEGFEIETELTVHALELRMPVGEIRTTYGARAPGTQSKLRTWRDGTRILRTIVGLVKQERPLGFFSWSGGVLMLAGLAFGLPVVLEYWRSGLVPRLPSAVLAMGLVMLAFLSFTCGLILDSVTRGRREARHIAYLAIPGPRRPVPAAEDQRFRSSALLEAEPQILSS